MGIRLSASQDLHNFTEKPQFSPQNRSADRFEEEVCTKKSVQNHCFLKPCDPETQFLMQVTNPNPEYLTSHSGN
jgi:hypothetical protein